MQRAFESGPDPSESDEAREVRLRTESDLDFREGRFDQAFNRMQQAGLDEAVRWFREEGVTFSKLQPEITPLELIVGLASAASAEVAERGEAASDRLNAATGFLTALASLRLALNEKVERSQEAIGLRMAEITIKAAVLGETAGLVNAVRLGWIDKLADFELERQQKRLGASIANAKKATVKENALTEAIRITAKNSTLGNEDLALKLYESSGAKTTVKTLTEWVREWRRKGFIAVQKAP